MTLLSTDSPRTEAVSTVRLSRMQAMYRRQFLRALAGIGYGQIFVNEPYLGETTALGQGTPSEPVVAIEVTDPEFFKDVVLRGSVGAGEAFTAGIWTTADLEGLIRLMLRNRDVLDGMEKGVARLGAYLLRRFDARNANSRTGSRRNIAAHYDLGNDFFAAFLDKTMTYSSAVFETDDQTLEQAQVSKLDRLCRKLDLSADDHVLELGTGWGSFAIHAASTYGCKVTTTTISQQQFDEARRRIDHAGVGDRVELLLVDYRDLTGTYDKLVTIEMVEAVGDDFLESWFNKCSTLLKPNGVMAMQAITIQDQHFAQALSEVDFIKRYIFPGSFIPSATRLLSAATAATDMRLVHMEDFGTHYAKTLRQWRHNVNAARDRLQADGVTDSFLRMWNYYLGYCAGGFEERFLGVGQFVLRKPRADTAAVLGSIEHRS